MSELKPCPFCKSTKVRHSVKARMWHFVVCECCGASTGYWFLKDQAVEAWNTRVELVCEVSYEYVGDMFPHSILVKELSCGHEVRIPFSNGEELQVINNCPVCGAKVVA